MNFYNLFWHTWYKARRWISRAWPGRLQLRCWMFCNGLRCWWRTTDTGKRWRIADVRWCIDSKPHHWDEAAYERARQMIRDIEAEPRFPFPSRHPSGPPY